MFIYHFELPALAGVIRGGIVATSIVLIVVIVP